MVQSESKQSTAPEARSAMVTTVSVVTQNQFPLSSYESPEPSIIKRSASRTSVDSGTSKSSAKSTASASSASVSDNPSAKRNPFALKPREFVDVTPIEMEDTTPQALAKAESIRAELALIASTVRHKIDGYYIRTMRSKNGNIDARISKVQRELEALKEEKTELARVVPLIERAVILQEEEKKTVEKMYKDKTAEEYLKAQQGVKTYKIGSKSISQDLAGNLVSIERYVPKSSRKPSTVKMIQNLPPAPSMRPFEDDEECEEVDEPYEDESDEAMRELPKAMERISIRNRKPA